MALRKVVLFKGAGKISFSDVTVSTGETSVQLNCYIKVLFVNATKEKANACVSFKNDKNEFEKNYQFEVDLDGGNFIKQAYDYLKKLPEFSDAIDC